METIKNIELMKNLVSELNEATKAYDAGHPIMSDLEWDEKYFQLSNLETKINIILPNSPTHTIFYDWDVSQGLKKVKHNHPLLSLNKSQSVEDVLDFVGDKEYITQLKLDGLTCSLHYDGGRLVSAETRGDGEYGEDITHNALVISSIPKHIDYFGPLTVDGEIICCSGNFEKFANQYKNPRNFAAGSIRLLDANECQKRKLTFAAWHVEEGMDDLDSISDRFERLWSFGFVIAPWWQSNKTFEECLEIVKHSMASNGNYFLGYPIDGLVVKFESVSYGKSLGQTAHHMKSGFAFKFADEVYTSYVTGIEYEASRNGILTPVVTFEPVETENSVVSRASLHNLTILAESGVKRIGQEIQFVMAKMIIPQIVSVSSDGIGNELSVPEYCPCCGAPTDIQENSGCDVLFCTNPNCTSQLINQLDYYCGKKGMDIKGLSKATLNKLIKWGWIENIADIYTLCSWREEWIKQPGFGIKSVDKILEAIQESRNTSAEKFIAALGIPLIGPNVAKEIFKHVDSYTELRKFVDENYHFDEHWDGFGGARTIALLDYDWSLADVIYSCYLNISDDEPKKTINSHSDKTLEGKTFVITGKLKIVKNRDSLRQIIENLGGKVTDSVSKNTTYLIDNEQEKKTTKYNKAISLNIPILTEEEFLKEFIGSDNIVK